MANKWQPPKGLMPDHETQVIVANYLISPCCEVGFINQPLPGEHAFSCKNCNRFYLLSSVESGMIELLMAMKPRWTDKATKYKYWRVQNELWTPPGRNRPHRPMAATPKPVDPSWGSAMGREVIRASIDHAENAATGKVAETAERTAYGLIFRSTGINHVGAKLERFAYAEFIAPVPASEAEQVRNLLSWTFETTPGIWWSADPPTFANMESQMLGAVEGEQI